MLAVLECQANPLGAFSSGASNRYALLSKEDRQTAEGNRRNKVIAAGPQSEGRHRFRRRRQNVRPDIAIYRLGFPGRVNGER
jgi:hypothetical protein